VGDIGDPSLVTVGRPYDLVLCVDVLFHLIDDAHWEGFFVAAREQLGAGGKFASFSSPASAIFSKHNDSGL
jgi:hypothetical protein